MRGPRPCEAGLALLTAAVLRLWRLRRWDESHVSPASVKEAEKLLRRDNTATPGIIFILLVSLVALWPVLDRRRERRGAEVQTLDSTVQVAATKVDSVQVLPEKAPAKADSAAKGPARAGKKTAPAKKEEKKPAADPAAIDEVFRQATEMFE